MATGGDNEREIIAGPTLVSRIEEDTASLIQMLNRIGRNVVQLRAELNIVGNPGEQIARTAERELSRLRLNLTGTLLPTADLREMEESLRQIIYTSEQAGQKINAVLTSGVKGGPSYKLSGASDIGQILSALQSHMDDLRSGKMKASITGSALTDESYDEAIAAWGRITQPAPAEQAARQAGSTGPSPFARGFSAALQAEREETIEREATLARQRQLLRNGGFAGGMAEADRRAQEQEERETAFEANYDLQQLARNAEKAAHELGKAGDSGAKASKFLQDWATGARPQRAFGDMLSGPLTSLLGPTLGPLMAGFGALVGGGAVFHMGWEITNQLAKIPQRIEWAVERERTIRMSEAMAGGSVSTSAASARSAISQFTGDAAGLQKMFDTLQVTSLRDAGNPDEQAKLATLAAVTAWWRPDGGNANEMAHKIQSMRQTGMGRGDIAKIPFVAEQIINKRTADGTLPVGVLGDFAASYDFIVKHAEMPEFVPGSGGKMRNPQAIGRDEVNAALETAVRYSPQLRRMLTEQKSRNIMANWFEKNIAGFQDPKAELFSKLYQSDDTLKVMTDPRLFGGRDGRTQEEIAKEQDRKRVEASAASTILKYGKSSEKSEEAWSTITGLTIEQVRSQKAYMNLLTRGDLSGIAPSQYNPTSPLFQQSKFSFSSLSEFANKMQTEASVNMADYAQKTASATDRTAAAVEEHLALVKEDRSRQSLPQGSDIPAIDNEVLQSG